MTHPVLLCALAWLNGTKAITYRTGNETHRLQFQFMDTSLNFSEDDIQLFTDTVENKLFVQSLTGTDDDLSRFAAYHFRNRFHCSREKTWYQWGPDSWVDDASDLAYKEALTKPDFLRYYQQLARQFETRLDQCTEVMKKARHLRRLALSLEDGERRDKLVACSMQKFQEVPASRDLILQVKGHVLR